MPKREHNDIELVRTWTLPVAVTLGSAKRAKGVFQELQARLPAPSKKSISLDGIDLILAMRASELHRWLADGRLQSAGTRTVRLNGRARQIIFHVFDPKMVEELLNSEAVDEWRVEDAEAKAEKRIRAAYRAKLKRLRGRARSGA